MNNEDLVIAVRRLALAAIHFNGEVRVHSHVPPRLDDRHGRTEAIIDSSSDVDHAILDRLPRRYRLIIELAGYIGLESAAVLRPRHLYRHIDYPNGDTGTAESYALKRPLPDGPTQVPVDLLNRAYLYLRDYRRGLVYGPEVTPEDGPYFVERDGRQTTPLDVTMALWRISTSIQNVS